MKKYLQLSAIILSLGTILFAQEKIEVSMKVVKDGKVVRDTTYAFDDSKDAKHAVHMFDAMASGKLDIHNSDSDHHMEFIHKEGRVMGKEFTDSDCEHGKKKVIKKEIIVISGEEGEDGEWTIKKGENGEEVMWKTIEGKDGEVITIKKIKGHGDEEEVKVEVIMKEKAVKKEVIEKKKKKKDR